MSAPWKVSQRRHQAHVHESGHAIAALCLELRVTAIKIKSETLGETLVQANEPATDRLREQALRSLGAVAVAGNRAVHHLLGEATALQELADEPEGSAIDRAKAEDYAGRVADLTGEQASAVLASFHAEIDDLLARPNVIEAVDRLAAALDRTASGSLEEPEILAAFHPPNLPAMSDPAVRPAGDAMAARRSSSAPPASPYGKSSGGSPLGSAAADWFSTTLDRLC